VGKQFYYEGIHFECTGCGECCRLGEGFVYPTDEDIRFMAHYLDMSLSEFADRFLEVHKDEFVLTSEGDDCIFLKDGGCTIYSARPTQCRTYPFWPANMKSNYRWKLTREDCEGIGKGRLYEREEIEIILSDRQDTDHGPSPGDQDGAINS